MAAQALIIVAISALLGSNLSLALLNVGGNYFPEIAVVLVATLFLIFQSAPTQSLWDSICTGIRQSSIWAITLVVLMLLGGLMHGDWANSYAEGRSIYFGVCSYLISRDLVQKGDFYNLYWIAVLSGIFSAILYFFAPVFSYALEGPKYPSPIYCAAFAAVLSAQRGKLGASLLPLATMAVLAAISFFRQYAILFVLVLIIFLLNSRRLRLTSGSRILTPIALFGAIFLIGAKKFMDSVEEDESMYIQSVGKTEDLLSFFQGKADLTESDTLRADYFSFLLFRWYKLLLPHGLGSKGFFGNIDSWFSNYWIPENSLDSILFYVIFHFGYIFAVPGIYLLLHKLIAFSIAWGRFYTAIVFVIFLIPAMFDGGAAVVAPRAISLGILLSLLHVRQHNTNTPEFRA